MHTLSSIIQMTRPINCLITFITISAACYICGESFDNLGIILIGGLAGLFAVASGNLINDYFDVESDKLNHPLRVLPLEKISKKTVILFFIAFNLFAYILSLQLGIHLFLIVLVTSMLLYFYSRNLKRIPLVGNITVALLTGLAFLFGSIIVDNFYCGIFPAVFAFLINIMRELIKDIEDLDGDKSAEFITYPIKHGLINTVNLISTFGVILIITTIIPFLFEIYNIKYFILVMLLVNSILIFVITLLRANTSKYNLSLSSNLLKINMLIGIIAIFLGSKF